ncbi:MULTISPECIES: preprotein translocase subunit SecY [unclassified Ruminococcus]|uniref:preprotein translocase subunit SecY n=1 Tax=unclassified Ruminococcus TaxID=2608920 RepID=UPI00210AA9EC|nr:MULTISPECIES: preprotein translocase subunit SecY [unclassified Ruminococcus]MCQ4023060.1 preprotein translocase subunit SecY [Ruminococcus sp. zg-924]MCQ4115497.1 preprotein translocase subunit SecY [Ruminococcus sp. zg-921]
MFKTIQNAWRIPDLRKKILFTLLIIVVFRIGSVIPVPFLDMPALAQLMNGLDSSGSILAYLNTLSGGAFSNATIFAMGVTPYINSSIIMQLLTVAIPPLERMAKEGEDGRKKIATITRYVTVGLGLLQGAAYYWYLLASNVVSYKSGFEAVFAAFVIILTFTAGTALMMWLGEQINQYGIGNGISILLFAGIVARFPLTITQLGEYWKFAVEQGQTQYFFLVPLFVLIFLGVIWVIVFMNDAERRIPVQYAKRVVGRKMYGGQSSHLPIKVGLGGVLPIIFASSILSIPATIRQFFPNMGDFWNGVWSLFDYGGWLYSVLFFILIIMFAYFYTTIQYNPVEMSNNLRQNNGTIPGIRPGKPTTDFIAKILSRITLIGALFLAVIAILPIVFCGVANMQGLSMGGTSVIILVGVALETVKQMESQMMMRHYKGFLD